MNFRTLLLAGFSIALVNSAFADITECDELAAHPSDPDKVVAGVSSSKVVTHIAIPACRTAVALEPEEARLHYQLGRALVYWAGANDVDIEEGARHVRRAAEMGHEQSEFVLGLLLRRQKGKQCEVEQWTRRAANQGLKSARITYVDEALSGFYENCRGVAEVDALAEYLRAAKPQISGYYEKLLWARLDRALQEKR